MLPGCYGQADWHLARVTFHNDLFGNSKYIR